MLVKIHKELEMMKKKSTDEIKALKAENKYMKQKLKEENTIPLNSTREYVETAFNSFEVSHKKPRTVSRDVDRTSIRKHPFS